MPDHLLLMLLGFLAASATLLIFVFVIALSYDVFTDIYDDVKRRRNNGS